MSWVLKDTRVFTPDSIAKKSWPVARKHILRTHRQRYLYSYAQCGTGAPSTAGQTLHKSFVRGYVNPVQSMHVYKIHTLNRVVVSPNRRSVEEHDRYDGSDHRFNIHAALRQVSYDCAMVHNFFGGLVIIETHQDKGYGIYQMELNPLVKVINLIYHAHLAEKIYSRVRVFTEGNPREPSTDGYYAFNP